MEALANFATNDSDQSDQLTGIGPAIVVERDCQRVLLEMKGQRSWAIMALGYRYEASPGDKVLVANQGEDWYVIGVLEGSGKTAFVAPGDMELRAPQGKIELVAAERVGIRSPLIKLTSKNLEFIADKALQKYHVLDQWVRDSLLTSAGMACHRVAKTYRMQAGKIIQRAKGVVKIDGDQIKLG